MPIGLVLDCADPQQLAKSWTEALGARRHEPDGRHEHGTNWVVLADPEGNEFCVCDFGTSTTA